MARLAARQWGVVSLADLRACGLGPDAVARRVRQGRLHPLHRSVYAVGHLCLPLEGRILAAVKACGDSAVASHRSAASLWGLLEVEPWRPEVTVHGPGTRVHPGVRVHRTEFRGPGEVTRHRGIPVTSPTRTLLDLAGILDERSLRRVVRGAQARRLVTVEGLLAALTRPGPRRGRTRLAQLVVGGPAPTRSVLEDVVLDLMLRGGLAHPDVNVPLRIGSRRVIPDFRWPETRLVVEADGAAWHEDPISREDDAERQALLEVSGERVLRVTWGQAVSAPGRTLARMRAAGAPMAE